MAALVGVGMGPGDPELVTVGALRALRAADRVFAPTVAVDAMGRAESIVRQAAPDVDVERLVFTMVAGPGAAASSEAAAQAIVGRLDAGQRVAFATLGDPNVYSTFSSVAAAVRRLRPDVEVETVPGIMAFQALAAASGTVVLDGAESLSLVTALDGTGDVEAAVAEPSRAVVVYKGGRHLPAVAKRLAAAGRLDGAVVGELLGLPGQRLGAVADLADRPATYLATVIVPPAGRPLPAPPASPGPAS
jgi:precorrin-2/cobalt-factor-2 C20-methyltransferase